MIVRLCARDTVLPCATPTYTNCNGMCGDYKLVHLLFRLSYASDANNRDAAN